MDFPEKTLLLMIKTIEEDLDVWNKNKDVWLNSLSRNDFNSRSKKHQWLLYKLKQIVSITDVNKKNRWFGYYQRYGEQLNAWDLTYIINMVRDEKNEDKNK